MIRLIRDILKSNKTLLFIVFLLSMILTFSFCIYWISEVNAIVNGKEDISYLIEMDYKI